MHVCKAGGKGIVRNPQLNRRRGTVYPTPTAVAAAANSLSPNSAATMGARLGVFLPGKRMFNLKGREQHTDCVNL